MPKGKNQKEVFQSYHFMCMLKDIHKEFQTEKEMNTYLNRHDKFCDCRLKMATGNLHLKVDKDDELTINDLLLDE